MTSYSRFSHRSLQESEPVFVHALFRCFNPAKEIQKIIVKAQGPVPLFIKLCDGLLQLPLVAVTAALAGIITKGPDWAKNAVSFAFALRFHGEWIRPTERFCRWNLRHLLRLGCAPLIVFCAQRLVPCQRPAPASGLI